MLHSFGGASFSKVAWAIAPFAMGICVGFGVVVYGLSRWMQENSGAGTPNLVGNLKRAGLQYLILGLVLIAIGGGWLSQFYPGRTGLNVIQSALWGFPVGLAAGYRWLFRRGERR